MVRVIFPVKDVCCPFLLVSEFHWSPFYHFFSLLLEGLLAIFSLKTLVHVFRKLARQKNGYFFLFRSSVQNVMKVFADDIPNEPDSRERGLRQNHVEDERLDLPTRDCAQPIAI